TPITFERPQIHLPAVRTRLIQSRNGICRSAYHPDRARSRAPNENGREENCADSHRKQHSITACFIVEKSPQPGAKSTADSTNKIDRAEYCPIMFTLKQIRR